MQKIKEILIWILIIFALCFIVSEITGQLRAYNDNVFSESVEKIIQNGYQYIYSKTNNNWREYTGNTQILSDDILVSKISEGKCFAFYFSSIEHIFLNKKLVSDMGLTFLKDGQLYIYDFSSLKLSRVISKGNDFAIQKISVSEIKKIYDGVEIIKTSDFKNGYLRIHKPKGSKRYIILSDTNYYAYNYGFGSDEFELNRNELPVITVEKENVKIAHSFFGDYSVCDKPYPCLIIDFSTLK